MKHHFVQMPLQIPIIYLLWSFLASQSINNFINVSVRSTLFVLIFAGT